MTSVETRTERAPDVTQVPVETAVSRRRIRTLLVLVVVLAVTATALAAWIVADQDSAAAVPTEVEETIDGFILAYEAGDEAALRAVVTEDYRGAVHVLRHGIGSQAGEILLYDRSSATVVGFAADARTNEWQIEQVGDPVVSGDRPWFVSSEENWTKCSYRDPETGECSAFVAWKGTATYAVVEEGGNYRIADYVWVGLSDW